MDFLQHIMQITAFQKHCNGQDYHTIAKGSLIKDTQPLADKRAYWKIEVKDKVFNFYPNKKYYLEDGLWQLSSYTEIPYEEYACDVSNNIPENLETEFDKETCSEIRKKLFLYLKGKIVSYNVIISNEYFKEKYLDLINELNKEGANINFQIVKQLA